MRACNLSGCSFFLAAILTKCRLYKPPAAAKLLDTDRAKSDNAESAGGAAAIADNDTAALAYAAAGKPRPSLLRSMPHSLQAVALMLPSRERADFRNRVAQAPLLRMAPHRHCTAVELLQRFSLQMRPKSATHRPLQFEF